MAIAVGAAIRTSPRAPRHPRCHAGGRACRSAHPAGMKGRARPFLPPALRAAGVGGGRKVTLAVVNDGGFRECSGLGAPSASPRRTE
eukprot:scaffold3791_cov390-Prasinococcus_capsulatus_cf.AAC.26